MVTNLEDKFQVLDRDMNERFRRRWAACEALEWGHGGISAVSRATGMSQTTIRKGIEEIQARMPILVEDVAAARVRHPGGGRRPLCATDAGLERDLRKLLEPATRGEPTRALLWTSKSTRRLCAELRKKGHTVSHMTVARMLHKLDYSLQSNRKTKEGKQNPDRDAQFEHINEMVQRFQRRRQPVISVDTKKRELIGDFKNGGREWRPKGSPEPVRVHDFRDEELGVAIPHGVYDMTQNEGWVTVGIDRDTAEFAVGSVRRWWHNMGRRVYPKAKELLITADSGGSNGSRSRLWKLCLQQMADDLGMKISVCHFPPGTSKWNKIEHRMFCHITENWRGRPLVSHGVVINLIGNTKTRTGLKLRARLDRNSYETGIKVSREEFDSIRLKPDEFHGDWNYRILPH